MSFTPNANPNLFLAQVIPNENDVPQLELRTLVGIEFKEETGATKYYATDEYFDEMIIERTHALAQRLEGNLFLVEWLNGDGPETRRLQHVHGVPVLTQLGLRSVPDPDA